MRIDLNSDLGESFGPWPMGQDAALMESITSANVACGFHAGDPGAMRQTIALAKDKGVAIGAHPGFPGPGRLRPARDEGDAGGGRGLRALPGGGAGGHGAGAGREAAARQGARRALQHGVQGPRARRRHCQGGGRLRSIADPVWPARTRNCSAPAKRRGLPVAAEVFADRAYERDGSLTSRTQARQRDSRRQGRRRAGGANGAR